MALLISDNNNSKYGTSVAVPTLNAGGTGYSANDVLTLTGGDNNATITVLTVDGSGIVLTVERTTVGSGYSAGTEATTVAPAGGSGCTIDITVQAGHSCVDGWYACEDYQVTSAQQTFIASTIRYVTLDFAAAGDCQGIVLAPGLRNTGNTTTRLLPIHMTK